MPRPPRRTETAFRPRIASRNGETRSKCATRRRRQPSRAPTTASAASAATGGPPGAESAGVLEIVKDPMSRPTDLANAASESVLGASNAGAGDPQRRRPWGGAGAGGGRQGGWAPPRHVGAGAGGGRELDVWGARQRGLRAHSRRAQRRRGDPRPPRPETRRSVQRLPASAAPSALASLHAKWALTPAFPPGLPDRSVRQSLRGAPIEREQKS